MCERQGMLCVILSVNVRVMCVSLGMSVRVYKAEGVCV